MDPANATEVCDPEVTINLAGNINMAGYLLTVDAPDLTPNAEDAKIKGTQIGTDSQPFKGVFNGDGRIIRNLTIFGDGDIGGDTTDGLFGAVERPVPPADPCAIHDLLLESPHITGYATDVGGLVGRLQRGTIFQCGVLGSGNTAASGDGANQAVGGLVGHIQAAVQADAPTVERCFTTCDVQGPTFVGGLVGRMTGPGAYVLNSYAADHSVAGAGKPFDTWTPNLGGLVGSNDRGAISCCYADCLVPIVRDPVSLGNVGALVGWWKWANAVMISNYCDSADDITNSPPRAIGANVDSVPDFAAVTVTATELQDPGTYKKHSPGWPWGAVWCLPQPGQAPRLLWWPF